MDVSVSATPSTLEISIVMLTLIQKFEHLQEVPVPTTPTCYRANTKEAVKTVSCDNSTHDLNTFILTRLMVLNLFQVRCGAFAKGLS